MCALHGGIKLRDSKGKLAQDVLIILDPRNPEPYHLFMKTGTLTLTCLFFDMN